MDKMEISKELESMLKTKAKRDKEIIENEKNYKEGGITIKEYKERKKQLFFGYALFCTRINEMKKNQ